VLFQPHRYSRTRDLMYDFARSFYGADVLLLTDIYPASEEPLEGVTSGALVREIERFGHREVSYAGPLTNGAPQLKETVRPGDLVLTLGAGSVWQAGEELLRIL
jgi:UDP-N-acetylmuramate--alanine ligase